MEERKKLIKLLKNAVINLGFSTEENIIRKRNVLLKVISLLEDEYHNFFTNIDMAIAYAVLRDAGINKNEISSTYDKLLKEEFMKNKIMYTKRHESMRISCLFCLRIIDE